MKYIEATLPTPAANLACDEALLDACEENAMEEGSSDDAGILRFWEPQQTFVVVGYANHLEREVNLQACQAREIPVLRRCSGGGTVLQGPGCLNYSLFFKIDSDTAWHSISETNKHILERHKSALQSLVKGKVSIQGCSDLTLDNLKFSGNAQRRRRHFLIFHGTFLLDFDLALVGECLRTPSKEPDYRNHRSHADFITNIGVRCEDLKSVLRRAWDANEPLAELALPEMAKLVEKYSSAEWNFKF